MAHRKIYLRFLQMMQALEGGDGTTPMDLDAKKLLEVIAVRHTQGNPLTVTEAMGLHQIASPATIHRKIDQLRDLELVETTFEGNNRRTKFLVPTEAAYRQFDSAGKVIQQLFGQQA